MKLHRLIRLKTRTDSPLGRGLLLIPLLLACFALSPGTQAVVPPPDGGYPGSNTAEGTQALFSLTTGVWNTALGFQSLFSDTTGSSNTATGLRSLFSNVNGVNNTATGVLALGGNTSGFNNTANGWSALRLNSTGAHNTAVGVNALFNNNNNFSTAVGSQALFRNTGFGNTAVGYQALFNNTTSGNSSNAFGFQSLFSQTTGLFNNGFGWKTLFSNVTGDFNTAIGDGAGFSITGDGNVCIGAGVSGLAGENNTTRIRNIGSTFQNSGIYVTLDQVGGTKLGYVNLSSRRYKEDIKQMDQASEAILALKPVTFRYKKEFDPTNGPGYGLIAEEVDKINPDLVSHNDKGEAMTVRYDAVNAMLLNEFLKEHRKVEEQARKLQEQEVAITALKSTVAQQQKGMEVLTAQLKEQAAQIQKVSAQLETSKPAPKVVLNNP